MTAALSGRGRVASLLSGLALLVSALAGFAGAATTPDTTSAKISARLSKTVFTPTQARSVTLIYHFSAPSKRFAYRLSIQKGKKWRRVWSVESKRKKGYFRGRKAISLERLFGWAQVKVGSYRLRLSAGGGGKTLRFRVIEADTGSTVEPDIAPTGPPRNFRPPYIWGTPVVGDWLLTWEGSWDETFLLSYTIQWQRCDSAGLNCSNVAYASGRSYYLKDADLAHTLRVVVTADNGLAAATLTSAQSEVVSAKSISVVRFRAQPKSEKSHKRSIPVGVVGIP
ncbi:MAG: hypothetical protein ACYDHO_05395 [Gaiellaceae bacterium]